MVMSGACLALSSTVLTTVLFPDTDSHSGVDDLGETVFELPPAPRTPYGTPAHQRRGFSVLQVSPKGADAAGNITMLVLGTAFRDYGAHHHPRLSRPASLQALYVCVAGDAKCKIGQAEVRAKVHHSGAITCTAPHSNDASMVPAYYPSEFQVFVSLNGVDFKGSPHATFWYFNRSRVLIAAVRPSGGPPAGGTLVNISGTNFLDFGGAVRGPKCRFGTVVVPATRLSLTQAQCRAPPQPSDAPESVPVFISLNGYTDERGLAGGKLKFRYRVDHQLTALHPLGGPHRGRSVVTVLGIGFVDTSGATHEYCAFDDLILCDMYSRAIGYGKPHVLGMIEPNVANPGRACLFGEPPYAVPATILSSNELRCPTPPFAKLRGLRPAGPWCASLQSHCKDPAYAEHDILAVPLRVTLNGNRSDTSTVLPWFVLPEGVPRLFYMTPWGGPADGGTSVTIVGEGLVNLGAPLCAFGHIKVPAIVGGVNATSLEMAPLLTRTLVHEGRSLQTVARQAGRLMTCSAPPGEAFGGRSVNVVVSLDGENWKGVEGGFTYVQSIKMSVLTPRGGPLAGGYGVTVHGSEFPRLGALLCDFGGRTVPASVSGAGQLRCTAPAATDAGSVPVRVSLNGELGGALSVANRSFTYFDPALVHVTSVQPTSGVSLGHTQVTVWGNGFAVHGPIEHNAPWAYCRFGDHEPSVVHSLKLNDTDDSIIHGFVCDTPPHELPEGQRTEDVVVEVSITGHKEQFSVASAAIFQYQALCYGRDQFSYYDAYPGAGPSLMDTLIRYHPEHKHYDIDGDMYVNETEYRAMRAVHDVTPDAKLQQALESFARQTCFNSLDPLSPGTEWAADRDWWGVPTEEHEDHGALMWT